MLGNGQPFRSDLPWWKVILLCLGMAAFVAAVYALGIWVDGL